MSKTPLAYTPHDHDHCVSSALAEADTKPTASAHARACA